MRRFLAAGALAIVLGVAGACGGTRDGEARWQTYSEPRFGWTIRYPAGWRFDQTSAMSRVAIVHWTFASFDASSGPGIVRRARSPRGGTLEWLELPDRVDDFPSDGVALRLGHRAGGPPPDFSLPEARFPLRLADLPQPGGPVEPVGLGLGVRDTRRCSGWTPPWCDTKPAPRLLRFAANGWTDLAAAVWIGPSASRRDRETLAHVLASLRFERLRPGQVTRSGFHVLEHETTYARGAVARHQARREGGAFARGFHLIRRADSFVALADPYECALRYDTRRRLLQCPSGAARWDTGGRRVAGGGSPASAVLARYQTRVTGDGWVLVSFGGDVPLQRAAG